MELATLELKLSGQVHNTVVKTNVTPAQLAIYAYMHGEDCVKSLHVTGVDKKREVPFEMNRLRVEFTSEDATKSLNKLFPGRFPSLPTTFRAIGYDPDAYVDESAAMVIRPEAKNQSEAAIMQKIKEAALERKGAEAAPGAAIELDDDERADLLDDSGDDDLEHDDDPLDDELTRLQNEGGQGS